MNGRNVFTVDNGQKDVRLDVWLARQLKEMTRSRIQQLIRAGLVTINMRPVKESHKIKPGERIEINIPPLRPVELKAENIPLNILFEDDAFIVVDKPAGMVVHPAPGHDSGTLVNAILHHCPDLSGIGGELRPGIVHRLDKDTSGVILVAKTDAALSALADQFKRREISKEYLAIVLGALSPSSGQIRTMIGRHATDRKKMTAVPRKGRPAVTLYDTMETLGNFSLVRLTPETGRTHQLRVHLAHVHHPVIGDEKYSRRSSWNLPFFAGKPYGSRPSQSSLRSQELCSGGVGPEILLRRNRLPSGGIVFSASQGVSPVEVKRQMLHARKIGFRHPGTGQKMEFSAPLPEDMMHLLSYLRSVKQQKMQNEECRM